MKNQMSAPMSYHEHSFVTLYQSAHEKHKQYLSFERRPDFIPMTGHSFNTRRSLPKMARFSLNPRLYILAIAGFLAAVVLLLHQSFSPLLTAGARGPPKPGVATQSPSVIPNIVHFVHPTDPDSPQVLDLTFRMFVAMYSAYYYIKPEILYIHTGIEDQHIKASIDSESNPYARALANLPNVVFKYTPSPTQTKDGKLLEAMAHRSDFARTLILREQGGIYLDHDAYVIKDLTPLRQSGFKTVIGEQPDRKPINAVMMSAPEAEFMTAFTLLQDKVFVTGHWTMHSIDLLTWLARDFSGRDDGEQALLLSREAFCRIGWEQRQVRDFYSIEDLVGQGSALIEKEPVIYNDVTRNMTEYVANFDAVEHYTPDDNRRTPSTDWRGSYVLHGWNSVVKQLGNTQKVFGNSEGITLEYVMARKSQFANSVYSAIKHAVDNGVIEYAGDSATAG